MSNKYYCIFISMLPCICCSLLFEEWYKNAIKKSTSKKEWNISIKYFYIHQKITKKKRNMKRKNERKINLHRNCLPHNYFRYKVIVIRSHQHPSVRQCFPFQNNFYGKIKKKPPHAYTEKCHPQKIFPLSSFTMSRFYHHPTKIYICTKIYIYAIHTFVSSSVVACTEIFVVILFL